ncbi:hypothetical protein CYMTET_18281 [Cymbomonas tetramitiformis]|uniref:Uncharacterized protein n=1 Tax=Cymbomonas tetramitiformis TaxID=36881 RepID=A0AAE0G8K9_9CHLO|nr:hypothetical protein CYMTET_18281 [Cymbomonas tetramitiformis]
MVTGYTVYARLQLVTGYTVYARLQPYGDVGTLFYARLQPSGDWAAMAYARLQPYGDGAPFTHACNPMWTESRESKDEMVLWNMRSPGSLEFYKERISKNRKENFFIFTADWVNYIAQTAFEISKTFMGGEASGFSSETGYTPTSGWTGLMIALNKCNKVTLYGMQVSESQGFPYHYHNRCPQPYAERDEAEWFIFKRFTDAGLASFREPCIKECRERDAVCELCRAKHPELYGPAVTEAGMKVWNQQPLPEYCEARVELLKMEKQRLAEGLPAYTKDERSDIMNAYTASKKAAEAKKIPPKSAGGKTKKP